MKLRIEFLFLFSIFYNFNTPSAVNITENMLKVITQKYLHTHRKYFILQRFKRSVSPLHPPCEHGDNWCENPLDYPNSFIKQVLRQETWDTLYDHILYDSNF